MASRNAAFVAGVPELLILTLLARREMYGYELAKAVEIASGAALSLGEGVLYPVLHSLEAAGALRSRGRIVTGRRRVYYSLTTHGRRRLGDLTRRWNRISGAVASVLGGSHG
jgi:PadR family transcriptional regulator, regulatory protein PadR